MASTMTTSATATILQAAEHILIDEAEIVAKQLKIQNTPGIKDIVNGIAKEAVAARDDSLVEILHDVEDGIYVVGAEVVKGAEALVTAVENHPELIAEGALAVAVGVVSIIQPELIVGSVALVGKMAADASKETINQIFLESGGTVVKGVAKGVSGKTAELVAEDAAEKARTAASAVVKNGGVEAAVDVKSTGEVTTEVASSDGSKDGEGKGTKVDVKALAKEVAREMSELESVKVIQGGGRPGVSERARSDVALRLAAAKLEADLKISAAQSDQSKLDEADEKDLEVVHKPTEETSPIGDDLLELLGITHESTREDQTDPSQPKSIEVESESTAADPSTSIPSQNELQDARPEAPKAEEDLVDPENVLEPAKAATLVLDETNHATTQAALASAHERIDLLHQSNELLHQKLDTMQQALLAITQALSERTATPTHLETETTSLLHAQEANQPVLASAAVSMRMSVFKSVGWLFGIGGTGKR